MDGDGIPLAFSITPGNTNEQVTMKPLVKKILSDFELSRFVVCTDTGLTKQQSEIQQSSWQSYYYQSIKKLKGFLKEWAWNQTETCR